MLPDISLEDHIFDVAFHPNQATIVACTVKGTIYSFRYDLTEEKVYKTATIAKNKASTRCVKYSPTGNFFLSGSSCGRLSVIDENANVLSVIKAHKAGINSLCPLGETNFATGCDEGVINIWDSRTFGKPVIVIKECSDYISDMMTCKEPHNLFATSGEQLSWFDLRKSRKDVLEAMSDETAEELLCLVPVKYAAQILVGTDGGNIDVFNWGDIGYYRDRVISHPLTVQSMAALDEYLVVACGGDSLVRVVSSVGRGVVGILGEHSKDDAQTIERVVVSDDKSIAATIAHDNRIVFHDAKDIKSISNKPDAVATDSSTDHSSSELEEVEEDGEADEAPVEACGFFSNL